MEFRDQVRVKYLRYLRWRNGKTLRGEIIELLLPQPISRLVCQGGYCVTQTSATHQAAASASTILPCRSDNFLPPLHNRFAILQTHSTRVECYHEATTEMTDGFRVCENAMWCYCDTSTGKTCPLVFHHWIQ